MLKTYYFTIFISFIFENGIKNNPILKGASYVFLKNTQNLTKKQKNNASLH
ncbi:hypothetical protein [uncultured Gammaproteobacteria bacterium]|nr:hypothetical protein [uncultured Gammaproteobacteria bacterium]CAC9520170.1 hypothetical protein [uncultured Gammaproteobacteria bacterium]CAC9525928.1 hypothetical protein [uncultured Gammaproteobacteria bacterium]CAC9548161.1 hypothetical protein [uncultured Gammaproteobacteria bacterium]